MGIIPARAGFTNRVTLEIQMYQDHPRSRGVYPPTSPTPLATAGSSPLARGLPEEIDGKLDVHRIIPARAGFTVLNFTEHAEPLDHPRSRGVYVDREC